MGDFRLALFDLDDTLIDHVRGVQAGLAGISRNYAALSGYTPRELGRIWNRSFWKYWPPVITGEITLHQSRAMRFVELFDTIGMKLDPAEAETIAVEYAALYISNVNLIEGAWDILEKLVSLDVSVGIVTNTTREMVEEKVSRTGIGKFISVAVSAQETGKMKPDAGIFQLALETAGYSRNEAVFTGDSIPSDVIGARNAGIAPVWYNRFGREWTESMFTVPVLGSYNPVENAYSTISGAILTP